MEFINRVRAHETIRLSVLSWIRYCSAITRFPVPGAVPGAEPGTHVHSHVVSDVILWRVLGKTGIFIAWVRIESLRDHRTCQIPLEKFMVPSQFTLWSAVLWCLLALCRKRFIEMRIMFWGVWDFSERNKIHALSQNMGIKKSENHLFKWNEMM